MHDRDYRIDNLRCLLIVLVVFCHLLVVMSTGPLTGVLYQVIYVFHMPVFVFVTGYFARWRPQRIACGLLLPYVEFQLLACLWGNFLMGRVWWWGFTLLQPSWTLWYLLTCVFWYATTPLLTEVRTPRARLAVVAAAFAASIAIGWVPWAADAYDLSRMVVLYPFFCAGFFAGKMGLSARIDALGSGRRVRLCTVFAALVAVLMVLHYAHGPCPKEVLYRNTPYANSWECEARVIVQLAAGAWCALLVVMTPGRHLSPASMVGRNSISVYLLHPWCIRILRFAPPLPGGELVQVPAALALAVVLALALGNDRVCKVFRHVFCGGWLKLRAE